MTIRNKLLVTYLSISLLALVLVAVHVYRTQNEVITHQILEQLISVSTIQKSRLNAMFEHNLDRLALVSSRTQLRLSLKRFLATGDTDSQKKMIRILHDANTSIDRRSTLTIVSLDGTVVASTQAMLLGAIPYSTQELADMGARNVAGSISMDENNKATEQLSSPLYLDDTLIGILVIETDTRDLVELATDYTGLGASGETVLGKILNDEKAIFLTPLRFDTDAALKRTVPLNQNNVPMVEALKGQQRTFTESIDYRGVPVLASTAFLERAGLGIVTKIDKSEAFQPIYDLRDKLVTLVILVAGAVIAVSLLLANKLTAPLNTLTHVAHQLSAGDYSSRAAISSSDEIGDLARAFNHMANQLQANISKLNEEIGIRRKAEARLTEQQDHLEETVQERTRELLKVNRELEEFCYSVSHDLRSPLRAIDGFSHALMEDGADSLDETGLSHLQRIRSNAQRMGQLIDDLLRLSHISRQDITISPVDLSALVEHISFTLKENMDERQIQVTIAPNIFVESDGKLLHIALENLLGNAMKYSSKEDRSEISFARSDDVDGESVFYIKDNGAGFDMRYYDKIFGVFQRLHGSEFEGTGIGLATVKRIFIRLGGDVWAESEPGQGATFYFSLPSKTAKLHDTSGVSALSAARPKTG